MAAKEECPWCGVECEGTEALLRHATRRHSRGPHGFVCWANGVMCLCRRSFPHESTSPLTAYERLARHVRARGGLAAHLLEVILGTR